MVVGRRRALINLWPPVHLRHPIPAGDGQRIKVAGEPSSVNELPKGFIYRFRAPGGSPSTKVSRSSGNASVTLSPVSSCRARAKRGVTFSDRYKFRIHPHIFGGYPGLRKVIKTDYRAVPPLTIANLTLRTKLLMKRMMIRKHVQRCAFQRPQLPDRVLNVSVRAKKS
jgi:hypothetical protein